MAARTTAKDAKCCASNSCARRSGTRTGHPAPPSRHRLALSGLSALRHRQKKENICRRQLGRLISGTGFKTNILNKFGYAACFPCAFFNAAHLFRCAAAIRFLPAALIVRFGAAGLASALASAHRLRCAAPILLRAAALKVRLGAGPSLAALVPSLPPSCRRMSLIFSSTFLRMYSNPINAASNSDLSTTDTFRPFGMKCCAPILMVVNRG